MKFIILLLLSIHLQSYCQLKTIPVKCNDSVLMSIKGKWKKEPDNITPPPNFSRAQIQEALKRMDAMHQLLQEAYPQPTGNEAGWWRNMTQGNFAASAHSQNFITTCTYSNYCAFGYYSCIPDHPYQVSTPGETSTWFRVFANSFEKFLTGIGSASDMTINGLPAYWRYPLIGKWKGYGLYGLGDNDRSVLLTRDGQLPYIPVTRKQGDGEEYIFG